MDIILTLFVSLVLYIGVAFYGTMKISSFSHHIHFFMVLTLTVFTVFVAALFYIYALYYYSCMHFITSHAANTVLFTVQHYVAIFTSCL
jgi:hypothetical protein